MPKTAKVAGLYINPKPILRAKERAIPRILVRQATYFRKSVQRSIRLVSGGAAAPGRPPFTHNSLLKNSIKWALIRAQEMAIVGPDFRMAGIIGNTHEFGGIETDNRIPTARTVKNGLIVGGVFIDANWKLEVGGHGPIRLDGTGVHFTKFTTQAQVERSRNLAVQAATQLRQVRQKNRPRRYSKRPFMRPKLRSKRIQAGLTRIYKDTIGPSASVQGAGRIGA